MRKYAMIFLLFSSFTGLCVTTNAQSEIKAAVRTSLYFERIRSHSDQLSDFLRAMPKGGDLHMHITGATYAEHMINYAVAEDLCISPQTKLVFLDPHCDTQHRLNYLLEDTDFKEALIDAWSMRHFDSSKQETSHDHFFSAFSKFYYIAKRYLGEVLAEIVDRAGLQNELYLELIASYGGNEARELGKTISFNPNFEIMYKQLVSGGIKSIVEKVEKDLDRDTATMRSKLQCDSSTPRAGCSVNVRYLLRAEREQAPELVFAQLLMAYETARHDPRIVGLNMVQSEDGAISMRDYHLHMQMLAYFHQYYPEVKLTLHAGELSTALPVPAEGLTFHIEEAIHLAHANRIGHGVDITHEHNMKALLTEMAHKHILVEVNLTSNEQVLNVQGEAHPLPLYLAHHVPVALSTDDEGVSRTDLSNEYLRAVSTYQLNYPTLKKISRNSLAFSFLPGEPLWQDDDYQKPHSACKQDVLGSSKASDACQVFLNKNEKAKMQWSLEARFLQFEQNIQPPRPN
jgi:adenosine deaminase